MTQIPRELLASTAPQIEEKEIPQCPVCGGSEQRPYAEGFDYELMTCRNLWRFVACRACDHVWLNPRPAVRTLEIIYPSHYYAYNYQSVVNPVARAGKAFLDGRKIKKIIGHLLQPPRSFLDIGCGDGRFLKVVEKYGVPRSRNYGLELDQRVISQLRLQGFANVFCERVEDAQQIPASSLDLITMFHVIEHVDDPGRVVRRVAEWLAPGGFLAIETPNLDSFDARLFKRTYWGGYHIPRHWNLFKPTTLSRLLEENGFECVSVTYQTGHSFWMYSMHHWLRYQLGWRRISGWFDPLHGLIPLIMFTGFDKIRGVLGFKTSAMLVLARKRA